MKVHARVSVLCGDLSLKIAFAFALSELTGDCRRYLDLWTGVYSKKASL